MNQKERDGLGDGWDCCLLAYSILRILIDRIFCNFDRSKKPRSE